MIAWAQWAHRAVSSCCDQASRTRAAPPGSSETNLIPTLSTLPFNKPHLHRSRCRRQDINRTQISEHCRQKMEEIISGQLARWADRAKPTGDWARNEKQGTPRRNLHFLISRLQNGASRRRRLQTRSNAKGVVVQNWSSPPSPA